MPREHAGPPSIPEPWWRFLSGVDQGLTTAVEIHCLGGFVLGVLWGLPRPTADVDYVAIRPSRSGEELLRVAGAGNELARRHGLYFQQVTIAEFPEAYESRLTDLAAGRFHHLRMRAFEILDLVLAKLGRNSSRDRADVEFLVGRGALDPDVLQQRFEDEMKSYVLNEAREAATLSLWIEEFFPDRMS